MIVKCVK